MGISVTISSNPEAETAENSAVVVCDGSPSMSELVYPIADLLKEKYPNIYFKSFGSLLWGEVYLNALDIKEFKAEQKTNNFFFPRF